MSEPQFVIDMKEAVSHVKKAQEIFAQGPLDYYLQKLVEHSDALLTKLSPIKKGDRARLVMDVPCDGGWKGSEKTLAKGACGVVVDVDYRDGGFRYTFTPDLQWYYHRDEYHISETKYCFSLHQMYLERIDD